jgi:putative radical SAM enzyme (TIGR03279 family)
MITIAKPFPPPYGRLHRWRAGDRITHVDGRQVEDILDLYFYAPADMDRAVLHIARSDGSGVDVALPPAGLDAIRSSFAPLEFKRCACACVFCFIDQNPKGMRDAVYVKDEDYRFSFLYGNYVTLTSLGERGLRRIVEQQLSPLYVSVHATDVAVRTRLLGIRRRIDVLALLRSLVGGGIEVHAQVVLCPGWNDGAVLERTFRDLLELAVAARADSSAEGFANASVARPAADGGVASLAIVPVGLTAHRRGLPRLGPVTRRLARALVAQVDGWQREAATRIGQPFVHLSDEFYLLAGEPFPKPDLYADFPQIDNGVGQTVQLREAWRTELVQAAATKALPTRPLTIVTGELAAHAWRRDLQPLLAEFGAPPVEVVAVRNRFFGARVTVAGLLTGRDLQRALAELPSAPRRTVALSPRLFNANGLTLDDLQLDDLVAATRHELVVPPEEGFVDFWRELA